MVAGLSKHGIQPEDLGKEAVAAFEDNALSRIKALEGLWPNPEHGYGCIGRIVPTIPLF
jgi:hypothetical protein